MKFEIESIRTINYNILGWREPKVTVFLDAVKVEFGSSGVKIYFDSIKEAISVLNNIIIQIK